MSIKSLLIYSLFLVFPISSCEREDKLIEDNRLQKEWELVSFYDNLEKHFIEFPEEDIEKIWIHFTEDSIFMHSYCPTVGSEYNIRKNSTISISGFIMQEEYCHLYENPPYWEHDLAENLRKSNQYQVTESKLTILSDGRYDLYFTEKKY